MSELISLLRAELIRTRDQKDYRHAYADESVNTTIATQIKVLREQRDLTQEGLAREAGMNQSMVCRYENVNYSSWSIKTLKKLAETFDVFLDVQFRSFRRLVESTENFSRKALEVPKFTEDPFFHELQPAVGTQRVSDLTSPILAQSLDFLSLAQAHTYITQVGSATSAAGGVSYTSTPAEKPKELIWPEPDATP